ncbi:hypothetical protein MNBD_GAMMA05-1881 [hydrothermal vent metagenome]|uniref:Uncharacterized protein n=1 Tax=hydrothermal vent metagenome TaxID=652676 RepID=A0A3B0WUT1_9ZZZZ
MFQIIKQHIHEILQTLRGKEGSDSITQHLVKGASGAFGINVGSNILLFILSVILARSLGAAEYGVYMYVLTWILALSMPAGMGLPRMLVRNVASYHEQSEWGLIRGLVRWTNLIVLSASLATIILVIAITFFLKPKINTESLDILWLALILLPILTYIRLQQSTMQGFHRVVIGSLPEAIIQPLIFILLTGALYVLFKEHFDAYWVVFIQILATFAALFTSIYLLRKTIPANVKQSKIKYEKKIWLRSALVLLFMGGLNIINSRADILMLGAITGTDSVGIYSIASRGAEFITFLMIPIHAALGPTIAKLYTSHDTERLQRIITKSTWITAALSLPIALGFIIFGYWFLLIFGTEFTQGQLALNILSIGKIASVIMGPVILLLVMTHHERDATLALALSAALNILLNTILIPQWGLNGAATATTASFILSNILMAIFVYRRIQINPGIIKIKFGHK